ncbi:hypothetical protein, partial [Protofrankia symbiont of Coriaria myrtifolia]
QMVDRTGAAPVRTDAHQIWNDEMTDAMLAQFAFAAVFFVIGCWGRRHAADLVSRALSREARTAKEQSLRRGARYCQIVAALFILFGATGQTFPLGLPFDGYM